MQFLDCSALFFVVMKKIEKRLNLCGNIKYILCFRDVIIRTANKIGGRLYNSTEKIMQNVSEEFRNKWEMDSSILKYQSIQ